MSDIDAQLEQFSQASRRVAKNLLFPGFDPAEYVKAVSAKSDGDRDLEEEKLRITALSDETAMILKKQVYNNYLQFIDTAKEISNLEQEMKQINNILTTQRTIMDTMSDMLVKDSGVDMKEKLEQQENEKAQLEKEQEQRKALTTIIERVNNCDPNLIKPGRFLVSEGKLSELDPESFKPLQDSQLFLLNDAILIATKPLADSEQRPRRPTGTSFHMSHDVSSTYQFEFDQLYDLDDIAVVNARDIGPMRNSFKILKFPEHRVFQCSDNKEKRSWIDVLDATKRKHMLADKHQPEQLQDISRHIGFFSDHNHNLLLVITKGGCGAADPSVQYQAQKLSRFFLSFRSIGGLKVTLLSQGCVHTF